MTKNDPFGGKIFRRTGVAVPQSLHLGCVLKALSSSSSSYVFSPAVSRHSSYEDKTSIYGQPVKYKRDPPCKALRTFACVLK